MAGSVGDGSEGAGLAGASATPIHSADGFLGYQGGGGPIQPTDFHIIDLPGSHTQDTHTPGMVIDHTSDTNRK